MSKETRKLPGRLIAALLSALMIFSTLMPAAVPTFAATADDVDGGVTITVTDEQGHALPGATVEFRILKSGGNYSAGISTTDENGCVQVLSEDRFIENDLSLSATVSLDDYVYASGSGALISRTISSSNQNFTVKMKTTKITDVTVTAASVTYDGEGHAAAAVSGIRQGDTVTYWLDDGREQTNMPTIKEPGTYTLKVKVRRNGFDDFETTVHPVVSKGTIELEVTEYSGAYDERRHSALTIENGLEGGGTITYSLNGGQPKSTVPLIKDIGTYSVTIYIKNRHGYDDFEHTYSNICITPPVIQGLTAVPYEGVYDGDREEGGHKAVTFDGIQSGDVVTYRLNQGDEQSAVPMIKEPGTYDLYVKVQRDGYTDFETTVHPVISNATLELNATGYSGIYDGNEHPALSIEGLRDTDTVTYSLNGDEAQSDIPVIKEINDYSVTVHVERYGYDVFENTYSDIHITKMPQTIAFAQDTPTRIQLDTVNTDVADRNDYVFTADGDSDSGNPVQYSLIDATADDVATIDGSTGVFTAQKVGIVTVKAVRPGNAYYEDAVAYATVIVAMPSNGLVSFGIATKKLYCGEESTQTEAQKSYSDDSGTLTYSIAPGSDGIEPADIGLEIDPSNGTVTVLDQQTLIDNLLDHEGSIEVSVKVEKSRGKISGKKWEYDNSSSGWEAKDCTETIYPAASAKYKLILSFAELGMDFSEVCFIAEPDPNTGWYNKNHKATVKIQEEYADRYEVKRDAGGSWGNTFTITSQGPGSSLIYLRDADNHQIFAPYPMQYMIDTVAPDPEKVTVSYSTPIIEQALAAITFGFYNPSVVITFQETEGETCDAVSGLDHLNWTYTREESASGANLERASGRVNFDDEGKAELILTGEEAKQYRGNISFTVTDKAGNTSARVTDEKNVFIVDTIAPNCVIAYPSADYSVESQHYYDRDVPVTITVTENNFYEEDFVLSVSKDGGEPSTVVPEWTQGDADNVFVGTFTLSGDGDYIIYAQYTDKSENAGLFDENGETVNYVSDTITIDTIDPQVSFTYDPSTQETTFTVVEHNFDTGFMNARFAATDRNGNRLSVRELAHELQTANWTEDGDTHTYTTGNFNDGIYNVTFSFMDPAGHEMDFTGDEFIIDHSSPTEPVIEYSKSILDTVLGAVTFGFYNPNVTVTFTSYDRFSGVDHFTWSYTRQDGASASNVASYADSILPAAADSEDQTKFTASITLPLQEAEQLRGSIAAKATDGFGNTSDKITDSGNILVVDTVSPTMTVEYSEHSSQVGTELYYGIDKKGQVEVTLNVTEANFFQEDVKVKVTKNGEETAQITPKWTDIDTDHHVGNFTLSGDGHYVVSVEYTDRSANVMNRYTSGRITLDTVKPVIDVVYQNTNVINKLTDREGNQREYFDKVQTAVVTITEHNFNAEDVQFSIVGKDVSGAGRNIDGLITRSAWSNQGDTHKMTITYAGDANYTFDVDYTDNATNKAEDYAPDYFTVDTVAPTIADVSYSASVLETVLSGISFGFYNAPVTVTITAHDDTSGVHQFDYSYLTAAGVSSVNAQLLNQAIEEANITYSDGGRTATITFQIPKAALGGSNQFNGTVQFDAIDRSNNRVEQSESKRVVVDNIAPTVSVIYSGLVNTVDGVSYFDGSINGTITINEANFYSDDVVVMVSKDGGTAQVLPVSWSDSNADIHIGSFTLTEDADYVITVTYRDKSGNVMEEYTSNHLVLDSVISEPTYTINNQPQSGDRGGAYQKEAEVAFRFEDQNLDTYTIQLTRMRFDKVEDVTEEFIQAVMDGTAGSGSFSIPEGVAYDGIYLLTITMTDKANHKVESHVRFTVNRFGSVYVYDEYLCSLIKDGGQYIKLNGNAAINKDLIITEYNADEIVDGSLKILITRDGEPIDVIYTSKLMDSADWFEYVYTISKDNFKEDGVYKITISSEDATGNTSTSVPDNSVDADGNQILDIMTFTVDTVAPEIRNVVNLENAIADKDAIVNGKLNVKYTMIDVGGLAKVEVYLNGTLIDTIEDFETVNSYTGAFDINESNDVQTVRLVATDLAGNVTDTAAEGFDPGDLYEFNHAVIVTTNFFVRWYHNAPLFWGTIGGTGAVIVAGCIFLLAKKKKRQEAVQ